MPPRAPPRSRWRNVASPPATFTRRATTSSAAASACSRVTFGQEHFRLQRLESGNALRLLRVDDVPCRLQPLPCLLQLASVRRRRRWRRIVPRSATAQRLRVSSPASIASHSPSARADSAGMETQPSFGLPISHPSRQLAALEAQFQSLAVAIAEGDDRREVVRRRGARRSTDRWPAPPPAHAWISNSASSCLPRADRMRPFVFIP